MIRDADCLFLRLFTATLRYRSTYLLVAHLRREAFALATRRDFGMERHRWQLVDASSARNGAALWRTGVNREVTVPAADFVLT